MNAGYVNEAFPLPLRRAVTVLLAVGWLIHVIAIATGPSWLLVVSKPVPVLCLIVLAGWWASGGGAYHRWIQGGLGLSRGGDVLLMRPADFFVFGLVAFLLAHICYIVAFSQNDVALAPLRVAPFLVFGPAVIWVLAPGLVEQQLMVPVMVYVTVILTMGWRAAGRIGQGDENRTAQWIGLLGALFFLASDSLIAFNKFYAPIPQDRQLIMNTYWLGQLGIAWSVRRKAAPAP